MSASNTDLARKGAPNFATALAGSILPTDTDIFLQNIAGLPLDTAVTITIDATDANGNPTPNVKETVTGVVNATASKLTTCIRGLDGTTAQAHANGAKVVQWFTANDWNDFITAFLVLHTQAGILNAGAIVTSLIADLAVTTAKLADGAVTPVKMSATKLFGVGGSYTSSPPAANGPFLEQAGSTVGTTNPAGNLTISFPTAFPNGVHTIQVCWGDVSNAYIGVQGNTVSTSGFAIFSSTANSTVRVNWRALGW